MKDIFYKTEKHYVRQSEIRDGNDKPIIIFANYPLVNPPSYEEDCLELLTHLELLHE